MSDAELKRMANCAATASAATQTTTVHEDLDLLPLLLGIRSDGSPGTFIEIGGSNGITRSQTLTLERCFSWRGLMIEAHPDAFNQMNRSGRTAHMVHGAGCTAGGSVTLVGGERKTKELVPQGCGGGDPTNSSSTSAPRDTSKDLVVPCRELRQLVDELHWDRVDFASVDVEGAEDHVLKTLDLSSTRVVLVEAEDCAKEKNRRVEAILRAAGLTRLPLHQKHYHGGGGFNQLWAHKDVVDYRPWYNSSHHHQHPRYLLPKAQQAIEGLRGGLAGRCLPGQCVERHDASRG